MNCLVVEGIKNFRTPLAQTVVSVTTTNTGKHFWQKQFDIFLPADAQFCPQNDPLSCGRTQVVICAIPG